MAHEGSGYAGTRRADDRIHDLVFIPRLREKLKTYVEVCPLCQRSKPSRQKPYGESQLVRIPNNPFNMMNIDFVTALLRSEGFDALAIVISKYTKYIRVIPGHEDRTAERWAKAFFDGVVRHHNIPKAIISNLDPPNASHQYHRRSI